MHGADLLAACALKMINAAGVIQAIALIKSGAKTENVLYQKNIIHCYDCSEMCRKGLLCKIKPYAFTLFVKRYGEEELLNCLERNEKNGIVYHRDGIIGDYDHFDDVEKLIEFIRTGKI